MQKKDLMRDIVITPTNRCNLACAHCLRGTRNKNDLPLGILSKILLDAKTAGFRYARLAGGELCLYPEFGKMIEAVVSGGFDFNFVSNCKDYARYTPVLEKYAANKIGVVGVSLDGKDEDESSHYRQRGSFSNTIRGISFFKSFGLKVVANVLVGKTNRKSVPDIIKILKESGIFAAWLGTFLCGTGGGERITASEIKETSAIAKEVAKQNCFRLYLSAPFMIFNKEYICPNIRSPQIAVNPYGEFSFCCNTVGRGAIAGKYDGTNFNELVQGVADYADVIYKEKRKIVRGLTKVPTGVMTECDFCHKILASKIKSY